MDGGHSDRYNSEDWLNLNSSQNCYGSPSLKALHVLQEESTHRSGGPSRKILRCTKEGGRKEGSVGGKSTLVHLFVFLAIQGKGIRVRV